MAAQAPALEVSGSGRGRLLEHVLLGVLFGNVWYLLDAGFPSGCAFIRASSCSQEGDLSLSHPRPRRTRRVMELVVT